MDNYFLAYMQCIKENVAYSGYLDIPPLLRTYKSRLCRQHNIQDNCAKYHLFCAPTGLVPCKRQEGKLQSLTLEEPCALRVMAAQAWSVVNARDIQHFESVLELLESIYMLVPRLVTSVKHMKIMFGLKTMVGFFCRDFFKI